MASEYGYCSDVVVFGGHDGLWCQVEMAVMVVLFVLLQVVDG